MRSSISRYRCSAKCDSPRRFGRLLSQDTCLQVRDLRLFAFVMLAHGIRPFHSVQVARTLERSLVEEGHASAVEAQSVGPFAR
jgi:hypothetical protein